MLHFINSMAAIKDSEILKWAFSWGKESTKEVVQQGVRSIKLPADYTVGRKAPKAHATVLPNNQGKCAILL